MTIQRISFAVASDEAVARPYSRQRLLNLFAETPQTSGKSPVLILGRWGLKPWAVVGGGPVRGSGVMAGTLYVVSGSALYSVSSGGVVINLGVVPGTGFVIMANNGFQLAIATGAAWVDYINGYFLWGRDESSAAFLYDSEAGTLGEISDADLFLEGRGKFQWSALNDGAAYDALDFATAESSPDKLIRGIVDGADIFMMGETSIEPWFNSGTADVFDRQNQTAYSKGILGTHLVSRLDNSVFWIGRDPEAGGGAIAYRLSGAVPQRISTHAAEFEWDGVDWSAARCISYIPNGHAFFHVILPDRPSWVYDCATKLWHEEDTFGLERWRGNSHSYAYDKHVIGSCDSGDLFELDADHIFDDDATPVAAEMVSLPIGDDSTWKTMASFQIDMETGVGLEDGSIPTIILSYSDDRGATWSNEKPRSFGRVGDYNRRVVWRQLGRFRSRVIKLRITDPVKRRIIDTFADIV